MNSKYRFLIIGLFTLLFFSCQEEETQLDPLLAPSNLVFNVDVSQDGSGLVNMTASADNAIIYHFYFDLGDSENPQTSSEGNASFLYKTSGTYQARVVAYAAGAVASSASHELTVQVDFEPPASLIQSLTNGSSRVWVWKKTVAAHFGVGPEFYDDGSIGDAPTYYSAAAFEKEVVGCLYEDEITFTLNGNGTVNFNLDNKGNTYFHIDEAMDALGVPRPGADECYLYDTSGDKLLGFFETSTGIANSTNVGFEITGGGFMSYFVNTNTYEILSYTADEIYVRTVQDIDGFKLAWYQKFIAADAVTGGGGGGDDYVLVWEDEFDTDGAPNAANWTYDLGAGGWGNNEKQFYTDRTDNVVADQGILKITAKRESFNGEAFTSARIKSQDLFEFTYGKVEVRAKLPTGGGTWPAIWMLGANFPDVGWPNSGEIDIMEHVGNNEGTIHGTTHSPSGFGGTANGGTTLVSDATSEFHVYSVEWSADKIDFLVDGSLYYTYNPATKDDNTYPFNHDFFLILNVAMGGDFGGAIDGTFTESSMEIDYVKVYQK